MALTRRTAVSVANRKWRRREMGSVSVEGAKGRGNIRKGGKGGAETGEEGKIVKGRKGNNKSEKARRQRKRKNEELMSILFAAYSSQNNWYRISF